MASSSSSHKHSFSEIQRETPAVSKKIFDAFINHRGPDVKETLAFALYDTLEEEGFWTFLDDMELELGDSIPSAIQDAIYSSKVQIAIFSPQYAESSWCLEELLLMLETKAPFVRIFFDVKPFDLCYPDEGVYAAALAKHEEKGRFSKEKLDQWKAALHSSSLISGYKFTASNDNVEMLCTNIVLAVQQEVGKTSKGVGNHRKSLHAASTSTSTMVKKSSLLPRDSPPVGLESKFEDMVGLLEDPKVQVGKHHKGLQQRHISNYVRKILRYLIRRITCSSDLHADAEASTSTSHAEVKRSSLVPRDSHPNLSDEDSWTLFCFYAFPNCVGNRAPQQLEEEGREIVKLCRNLPLAIKIIAASLANTTLLSEWELKRSQLERVVTPINDHDPVMEILKLSYESLPAHLKPCFAYLSFFPADEEIKAEYLINLWIGEGFVPAGEDQWDMGWEWLDQLAQLCLLQLYKHIVDTTWYCGIHDLLRELAIHISKEDKCVFSVEEISAHTSGATGWHRILLAKRGLHDLVFLDNHPVYLRTLSLYRNEEVTSIQEKMFTGMKGLRVLDLSWTGITTLPTSLGRMILLKVLNLRATQVEEVPECVRHLKSLSFLVLPWLGKSSAAICTSLPAWISELRCLQHLEGLGISRIPKGISELRSLRTLRSRALRLSIEDDGFMRLEDLVNMIQLQEVSISLQHEMDLKRAEEGILAQLVNMRRLKIENGTFERLQFSDKMRAMKHLETLRLEGFTVPSWIHELANLRELELIHFECSVFPELQTMPNLEVLKLERSWHTKLPKAFGKSGGFRQLRHLTIGDFHSLEKFPKLEEGALASLQLFSITFCNGNLKPVQGLERLKRLVEFYYSSRLSENGRWETLKEGGKYWNKIKAINPNVRIRIND